MTARSNNGRFESTRTDINNDRESAVLPDMDAMFENINAAAQASIVKFAIGFAYAYVGFLASWHIAVMCALLTSVVWLQYIIAAAVFAACLAVLVYAVPTASEVTYNAGAYVAKSLGSAFGKARAFFAKSEPAPEVVH